MVTGFWALVYRHARSTIHNECMELVELTKDMLTMYALKVFAKALVQVIMYILYIPVVLPFLILLALIVSVQDAFK